MKYTIEQINKAWIEFNKPNFSINSGLKIENQHGSIIEFDRINPPKIIKIEKQDFISFLIDFYSESQKSQTTSL